MTQPSCSFFTLKLLVSFCNLFEVINSYFVSLLFKSSIQNPVNYLRWSILWRKLNFRYLIGFWIRLYVNTINKESYRRRIESFTFSWCNHRSNKNTSLRNKLSPGIITCLKYFGKTQTLQNNKIKIRRS